MNYPRITLVTPSFNQGQFLEKTILSVLDQNYPNLEYMIIDGGSTDNSVDIIKKYANRLTYWVSEKDNGQSHAINKGLSRATGDIFNWLCSDDLLEPGSLEHIAEAFRGNADCQCYAGRLKQVSSTGTFIGNYTNMIMSDRTETLRTRVLKQPAVFFSMNAVRQMGPLNERLHYAMDADWFYRFFFIFKPYQVVEDDFMIGQYLLHESSKSGSQVPGFVKENHSIYYNWAKHKGLLEYADLLESRGVDGSYIFPKELLDREDASLIKRLIFYHLLKTSVKIYKKDDFIFAERFLQIDHGKFELKPDERSMMDFLDKFVRHRGWFSFWLRRAYMWRIKGMHLGINQSKQAQ